MHPFLLWCFLLAGTLGAQPDSLLHGWYWEEEGGSQGLLLLPGGTFQIDYGPEKASGRYLMGRYRVDSTGRKLTLGVDYFLGKSHLPERYRRDRDYYLEYTIIRLDDRRLVLLDVLTDDLIAYLPRALRPEDDPARRRAPNKQPDKWKLPDDWGGG